MIGDPKTFGSRSNMNLYKSGLILFEFLSARLEVSDPDTWDDLYTSNINSFTVDPIRAEN